jgi:hypothetical protein
MSGASPIYGHDGWLYILENTMVGLVKIGATINSPHDRLLDINRMWLGEKGLCQICNCWRVLKDKRRMPPHVLGGMPCGGSNHLPLHIDTKHAEQEVANLQNQLLTGSSDKIPIVKKLNGLKKRIEFFKTFKAEGEWTLFATWKIANAYYCEEMVHSKLEGFKYDLVPFGEVFKYPSENARQLVTEVIAVDF